MRVKQPVSRGKPAEYGQEIVKRRFRRTAAKLPLEDRTLLDFGCGNGAQTVQFLSSGCRIIAVDLEYDNLVVLSKYLRANHIESVLALQYDGSRLPIKTASIDVVLSYEVIEHVVDESVALNELHRVLKRGGEMILSVPNKGWIFETHGAYLPLLPWNRVPFFSWIPHRIHRRFARARIYRKCDILQLLQSHSFRVLSTEYITAPMDVVKLPWLQRFLRSTIFSTDTTQWTFLSTAILVHCSKI